MISINIFDVIRPMPIGWDDMWVYLNMPQRIAEDAAVLSGQGGQAYMLLTSIWFSLWPEYVWDNVAMFINWFWWILSVFAVFIFTRRFFNEKMAIFTATFYYFMPMITFQSALDMKMDPPLFFFMVTWALILFDRWHWILDKINDLLHRVSLEEKIKWGIWWMILATAFFIKITTAMELFALVAMLSYFIFNWKTAIWVIFLEIAIFLPLFSQVPEFSETLKNILSIVFWISWIALIWFSKIKKHQFVHFRDIGLSTLLWFLVVALPWFAFNYNDSRSLSFWRLVGWAFHDAPKIDYDKLWIDRLWKDKEYCTSTWWEEEKWRYIWYDQPFVQKYFTLPWKNTMNTETRGYYLDIWFLYLALIPWIFLLWIWRRFWKKEWWVLILFSVNWFFWAFSAHWIPWYWLFWFLPALILAWMVLFDEKTRKTEWKYFYTILIIISIASFAYLRETKTWNASSMQYSFWLLDWGQVVDSIVPTYRDTVKQIDLYKRTEQDPWYLYRIWTFIPYFVKDVRRVMKTDSQLDTFRCLDWDWTDDQRTLKRFKDLWFKFFILDTNTPTIETFAHVADEIPAEELRSLSWLIWKELNEKRYALLNKYWSLHKKFGRFIEFADKNLKIIYVRPNNWISFMAIE